jgi:hypothetical protein
MDFRDRQNLLLTRRHFFAKTSTGLGVAALGTLLANDLGAAEIAPGAASEANEALPGLPHFAPRAKRVIYLFQSGGPSQMELFDYKPKLKGMAKTELPDSIRMGQRLTGMTSTQTSFPVAPSIFGFKQYGSSGTWVSDLLPHTAKSVDDICLIKSMFTEQINHDPAVTFCQTGFQLAGRPSIGSWLAYGLGSESKDLPAFVVMISQGSGNPNDQPLADRQWGSGFLPTKYQGVKFRSAGDPVLYLSDPPGFSHTARRRFLDDLAKLNQDELEDFGDPEIATRISQYEMAYKMQTSVPELTDLSKESPHTFELYGQDARKPGTFAANCLLARRLSERGVRFVQLFHRGWDQHGDLPKQISGQARDIDQACAGLIQDLKERDLLKDTLVVWGGEFGRTVYCQGKLTPENYGRDHHPRCFTMWMAGGGVKPGLTFGESDDYCYNIVKDPVHVHDLHATMLYCLGIDHTKLTYKFQGRHFRLTDVHGNVVKQLLS